MKSHRILIQALLVLGMGVTAALTPDRAEARPSFSCYESCNELDECDVQILSVVCRIHGCSGNAMCGSGGAGCDGILLICS